MCFMVDSFLVSIGVRPEWQATPPTIQPNGLHSTGMQQQAQ
jgi:hypothetical protein